MRKMLPLCTLVLAICMSLCACAETYTLDDELLIKQIDAYFTMSKEEIIETLGPDFLVVPAGPEGAMDGYFYEDIGMAFAFYSDSKVPELIDCYPNFRIHGVGEGSLFSEIFEALGDTEIIETWMELPIYTVYMVQYQLGDALYSFFAFEEGAPVHLLRIGCANQYNDKENQQ